MRIWKAMQFMFGFVVSSAAMAQSVTWHEDVVTAKSCKKLVAYQQKSGVRASDKTSNPGKWAVTKSDLRVGDVLASDPRFLDEISFEGKVVPGPRGKNKKPTACVVASNFDFKLHAEHHITAIEWQHGRKPDSKCAKEWQRIRNIIHTHEPIHVQDVDEIVAAANERLKGMESIKACGSTEAGAKKSLAKSLVKKLKTELNQIKKDSKAKAETRDTETAQMNCKLCEEGVAFKVVDIYCEIKTPQCVMMMGQKITGRTCGDPLTASWTITPEYYVKGCNVSPSNPGANKAFESDCVEAGSAEEKRRAEIYRNAGNAGGWFCVYSDTPKPQVTIRSFRLPACEKPVEQTVTVDLETAESCD
jgi:Bacterial protein of unknown function (DUF922)